MNHDADDLMKLVISALNRQRWPISMLVDALAKLSKLGVSTYIQLKGEHDYIIAWTTFMQIDNNNLVAEVHNFTRGTVLFKVPAIYRRSE